MSFARYPNYKDSGVEWLGEVPGHWETLPLSRTASKTESLFIDGDWIESKDLSDDGIRYLTSGNVGDGYYKEQGQGYISEETFTALNCVEVIPGDVLISRLNLPIGRSCLVPDLGGRIVTCVDNVIVRPDTDFDRRFFVYQLTSKSHFANMENLARGTTMPRISRSVLGRVRFAFPPLFEQTQIAAFLDRETEKIDGLVAEQRRLMALLKEKRQAVISHAVTRGLNPDAPMKPSGIEWLGDVPEHWDVLKGTMIGTLFGSEQVPEDAVLDEGDLPFIKVGSLSRDSFEIESWDYFVTKSEAVNYRPRSGYIVFPKRGAAIFTNKVNIVDRPSLIDPNLMGWQIGERAVTGFIAYALKCRKLDELADVSTVPQINNKHIAPERFGVPPIEEQHRIVAYLNAESAKFDTLTLETQHAIDLLQERRTALISAAVTGQIDVRDVQTDVPPARDSKPQSAVRSART